MHVPTVTAVPEADLAVEGLINLRGQVVPVVNLGRRLAVGAVTPSRTARVVVVEGPTGPVQR